MLTRDAILEQMRERVHHPAGTRELLQLLKVPKEERATFRRHLKSLVAAGYGAALLPHEAGAPVPDPRICMRPLKPALVRTLGIAHRARATDAATEATLAALDDMRGP